MINRVTVKEYEPCPPAFFDAYVITALWSSTDESDESGGVPLDDCYDVSDIDEATLTCMRRDCDKFYAENKEDLTCAGVTFGPDFDQDGRAGHDFWLTRNHHGAGFWDGDWPEPQAANLTKAAHMFGEIDMIVGDDGKIHHG